MELEFDILRAHVGGHHFWLTYLSEAVKETSPIGIHLAVVAEPFLSLVLSGEKTIESRFSRRKCAPYGEIDDGDVILLKEVAGPICGVLIAQRTWCYDLSFEPIEKLRLLFGAAICADEVFWSERSDALYATLIELHAPTQIAPFSCDKRDRRGWVSLKSRQRSFDFA